MRPQAIHKPPVDLVDLCGGKPFFSGSMAIFWESRIDAPGPVNPVGHIDQVTTTKVSPRRCPRGMSSFNERTLVEPSEGNWGWGNGPLNLVEWGSLCQVVPSLFCWTCIPIPSHKQTWQWKIHENSLFVDLQGIFRCHVWLPEGKPMIFQ